MKVEVLPHYEPLLDPYDYKIMLSGRGSAKTFHVLFLFIEMARSMFIRILCCREFQNSILDSSHAELVLFIKMLGYDNEFKVTKTRIYHKATGSVFIFRGLSRYTSSLKSIPMIDIAFIEECEDITENSLVNVLMPTIRENGSELWACGNPKIRTSAISDMFVENEPPPNTLLIRNNYMDNKFISEKFIREAEHIKKTKPALYRHIYLGEYLDTMELSMVHHINIQDGHPTFRDSDIVVIGVDIARSGGDKTTIWVRRGHGILHREHHYEMDIDKLAPILGGMILRYEPDFVNVDSTGHGAWVPDALKGYGVQVHAVNFASKAYDEEKYANKRTELYGLADDYFIAGGTIPNYAPLIQELEASFYLPDSKNRASLMKKDDIRKIINRSPDDSDGFCLCLETHGKDMFTRENTVQSEAKRRKLSQSVINAGRFKR